MALVIAEISNQATAEAPPEDAARRALRAPGALVAARAGSKPGSGLFACARRRKSGARESAVDHFDGLVAARGQVDVV
ncbi:MAG: hypothetical protein ABI702_26685, partial [Burkholderiales bacterium]